ncbi:Hypothetical predicted protein [Xyrichtys novacula]|uniref:Uncharacterized protein n=1 Tax=Xyrichtys novacula TaxID=13765 RepID=A0AAV1HDQ9_XYRNO|nr:Hypothetical predicted protein [Xyrichtys novacula]
MPEQMGDKQTLRLSNVCMVENETCTNQFQENAENCHGFSPEQQQIVAVSLTQKLNMC